MTIRRIAKIFKSRPTIEGAGVHLKRAFGYSQVPQFDPFLMLDDFHTSNPDEYLAGFPWHPHRGIETITYVLEGLVEHGDSMGNKGVIGAGDVQWMTAGSGIIHQEMPKVSPTGTMWGFQFWANLPASQKMMPPRYRDVKAADIPEVTLETGVYGQGHQRRGGGCQGPGAGHRHRAGMLDISFRPGPCSLTRYRPVIPRLPIFCPVKDISTISGMPMPTRWRAQAGRMSQRRCICAPETVVLFEHAGHAVQVTDDRQAGTLPVRLRKAAE